MKTLYLFRALALSFTLVLSISNLQPAFSAPNSIIYDGKFTVTELTYGTDQSGGHKTGPEENTLSFIIVNNRATGDLNGTIDPLTGKANLTQQTEFGPLLYKATFIFDKNSGIVSMSGSINGEIVVYGATVIVTGTANGQSEANKLNFTLRAPLPTARIGKKYTPFSLCNDNKPVPKGHACGGLSHVSNPSGGVPPYTFRVTGILPRLTLNSRTGVISGTPTGIKPATYRLTICAYDMQDTWNGVCWKTSITYKK